MRHMMQRTGDDDAVTSTEYAVMLALLLGICTSAINCLGVHSQATYQRVGDTLSGQPNLGSDD
jgi:Flp pilus assembly pilin Flp